ncbi:MAG: DUF4434 domain-containing protein [Negativicutes bacterium]
MSTKNHVSSVKPYFSGSFIQSWYCQDWDIKRWHQELSMLRDIGITEIIIQSTVGTTNTDKYASYPSKIAGYRSNDVDLLANALKAADDLTMKIRIGTGDNHEWWKKKVWWKKGAWDRAWLLNEAQENVAIVEEIAEKYTTHFSFAGWYIPYEIYNITAITRRKQADLNAFFKSIVNAMKIRTPEKTVMVSPFYNSKLSMLGPLANWTKALTNIFIGTGVDIIALQDSIGVGYNQVSQLENIFNSAQKAAQAVGAVLYANNETFALTENGNIPATQRRITLQIEKVRAYVAGYVAFSLSHYQNKYRETNSYMDYKNYYLSKL